MSKLEFITTAFGQRYLSYLPPLLYSITKSNPSAKVLLLWQDIPQAEIQILLQSFPAVKAIKTDFDYSLNLARRISSKTLAWKHALNISTSKYLFFLDSDMLVLKELSWLTKTEADIVISKTGSFFPINSGVVYCHNTKSVHDFFKKWAEKTISIINSPQLFSQVNDKRQPFGGADQMALIKLIKYSPNQNIFNYVSGHSKLRIASLPCKQINEIQSTSITADTHVVHFKGGWRHILFYGDDFTSNRPKIASWEMYILYLKTYFEAVSQINSQTGFQLTPQHFGLHIPFYIDTHTWKEKPGLYPIFQLFSKLTHYTRTTINLFWGRDLNY